MDPSLKPILDFIESQGGEILYLELTKKKFEGRATLIDYPVQPEWIAFEIERHGAILGAAWQPGTPMAAFRTYWPCYAFNPATHEFHTLEERRTQKPDIDYSALASQLVDISLRIEPNEEGGYRYQEATNNWEGVIGSLDEFITATVRHADELSFDHDLEGLEEYVSDQQLKKIKEELLAAVREHVTDCARSAWEEYEE